MSAAPPNAPTFVSAIVDRPTTRLAPSPTGPLHLGHARSFLAAWWMARARGGRVLVRIEDLDTGRCRPQWTAAALADLEWLGLDWDGPVVAQSSDLEPYHSAIDDLLARGAAYACVCSRRELRDVLDAPHGAGHEVRYPGTCRGRFAGRAEAERSSGAPAGVRFRVPDGAYSIDDLGSGRHTGEPARECGDFLLTRRDGAIAYQLAVVVDDARQGVDLVVRGDDLRPSALRQALLQRALGLPHPAWLHVPLVHDTSGERLAKRTHATALADLRNAGVRPEHIASFMARSLGFEGPACDAPAADWISAATTLRWPRAPLVLDSSATPHLVDRNPASAAPPAP